MTLPALVDYDSFVARIPGGVADGDQSRAQAAIDDASSIIRAEAGESWVDAEGVLALPDDPDWAADALQRICMAVARRAFENPDTVTQRTETVDGYSSSETFDNSSADVYLKASEKSTIAKLLGEASEIWTLGTTRCDTSTSSDLPSFAGDVYIEVPDSELLPFLPVDAPNGL